VVVCVGPLFASGKIPLGLTDSRMAQDLIEAALLPGNSEPGPQAGGQQDANSQPGAVTSERVAPKPPQITYQDGQLTIVAENSPLSEVMSALRAALGADIDLPVSVAHQRIWVRLGPGPARNVLRELLDNTELDFVIQASDSDEQGIRSVLLTVRTKTPEAGIPGSRVATNRKNLPASPSPVEVPEQDSSAPAESAAVSDTAAPAASPSTDAPSTASKEASLSKPGGGQSEQMIQQLQSMYEQRRQIQMQQNQKPSSNNN